MQKKILKSKIQNEVQCLEDKILEIKVKKLFVINENWRYKIIDENDIEYRFYWTKDPSIIELQVIKEKKIIFKNVKELILREGEFNKKTYKFYEIK